jgi:hypothetical protein
VLQDATDEQAAAKASEHSNRQLEVAVTRQRLQALQEQQLQLQQTIAQLPQEQQAAVKQQHHRQKLAMLLQQQQQGRKGKGKASKQQQGLQDAGQPLRNAGRGQGSWDPAGTAAAAAGPGAEGGLFSPSPQQQLWQQRQQQQASSAAEFDIDALAAAAVGARGAGAGAGAVPGGTAGPKLVETERDRMIRLGLLTPFDKLEGFEKKVQGGAAAAAAPQVRQVRFGTGAQQLQQRRQQQQSTSAHAQQQQQQQHKQQQPFEQPDAPDLSLAAEQAAAGPAAGAALPPRPRPSRAGPQHQHAAAAAVNTGSAAVADEQWALLQQRKVVSTAVPPSSAAAAAARGLGDMAHRVGRSGLPLGELMARTSQQSVEQGVLNRPRAILMEGDQVSCCTAVLRCKL